MTEAIALRPYQVEAVNAVYDHLRSRDDNPCVVLPTASGKTPVAATICRDAVQQWGGRVLILAHVKELLEQAVDKLHAMAPDLWNQIGVYSAGLKSRDTEHSIIVAGIQSVYRRAAELDPFALILIDEAHLITPGTSGGGGGEGMYRTFLADAKVVNPNVRLIGLTATPYRMSTGLICGPDNLLNHVCYDVGVRELIVQGYLCPLKSKAGKRKVDTSSLHIRGGEFIAGEVEALMDDDALVSAACREFVEQTTAGQRHSVLIFAAGVQHAMHVQRALGELGQECGFVCGETLPFERDETLRRFKGGGLRYLVNVNVLTTGFDAPNIDCVVLLRPTNSPGLYCQSVGRGFRLHPSKTDSLVLDFGGNILRHGPVDAMQIDNRERSSGEAPAKECPECHEVIHAAYSVCPECGYEFPARQREQHDRHSTLLAISTGPIKGKRMGLHRRLQDVNAHLIKCSPNLKNETPPRESTQLAVVISDVWDSKWFGDEHRLALDHRVLLSGNIWYGLILKSEFGESCPDLITRLARAVLRKNNGIRTTLCEFGEDCAKTRPAAMSDVPRNQFMLHVLAEDAWSAAPKEGALETPSA